MVSLITRLQFLLDAVFSWVNATLFWFSPFSLAFMPTLVWLKMSCSSSCILCRRLYSLVCPPPLWYWIYFIAACLPVTFPLLPLLNFSIACQTNVEDLNAWFWFGYGWVFMWICCLPSCLDGNGRIFTLHETRMLKFIIFRILFSSVNTVIVVKLSFMVAKKLVSAFSDLVTQIINTFNFSVIFIGLHDWFGDFHSSRCEERAWLPVLGREVKHLLLSQIHNWNPCAFLLSWWWGSHSKCNDEDDDKFNFDTAFFTWINPLTPKMLVERVLVMLVKFGGVEPYLLGKSGLARDRRVLKHGKSTANSIVNYLHPQAGEIIFNS